jgi:hypothetical protein
VWDELQKCRLLAITTPSPAGLLLGFVFSAIKTALQLEPTASQGTFVLNESNLKTMVLNICKGSMSTDYLSAGSVTCRKFRELYQENFQLTDGQTAQMRRRVAFGS